MVKMDLQKTLLVWRGGGVCGFVGGGGDLHFQPAPVQINKIFETELNKRTNQNKEVQTFLTLIKLFFFSA